MTAKEISAADLRANQGKVLNEVAFKRKHYIVTRHGEKAAVMISFEDFELLKKVMKLIEDNSDVRDAQKSYADYLNTGKKAKSLEKLAKELGIAI